MFNTTSIVISLIGGLLCQVLGGWDLLLKALVAMVVLDYLTGVLQAIYTKTLSSHIGYKGLIRKIVIFVVVAVAVVLEEVIGTELPLREITILFFISNEGISLLENADKITPLPDKLRDVLIQLRERG